MSEINRGVSRRTLAKGAAWAVPAVTIAAPAPAMAASTTPFGVSSTWYSCHNGTFKFYFNPPTGVTITKVQIQSDWAPFNSLFTLDLSTVTKDAVNASAKFLAEFQNPGGTSSQPHFTTPLRCALGQMVYDNARLIVTYTGATGSPATIWATEMSLAKHTAGNAQSCGVCPAGSDPGATTFANSSLQYNGEDGEWTFEFTGVSTNASALITKVEMYTGACGNTVAPFVTWTGTATSNPTLTVGPTTQLGTCGTTKQDWYGHYGSNEGTNSKCPSSVLVADTTYFKITHANGYVETLYAPANGSGKYKYTKVKNIGSTVVCPT